MYNAQETISRVQSEIKKNGYTQKNVLSECGLSENMLKQMTDKQGMASFSLAKIADYLDCSVDYLLGRTDNSESHKVAIAVALGDISNNNGVIGGIANNAPVTINSNSTAAQTETLLNVFNGLDPIKQAKLLVYADELEKGE